MKLAATSRRVARNRGPVGRARRYNPMFVPPDLGGNDSDEHSQRYFAPSLAMAYHGTMDPNQIKSWIDIIQGLITIAAMLIGGFWAWSRFVVERGLMPPSQMDLALRTIGSPESATIVEIAVRIRNKGSAALVVSDLRIRLRYLNADEEIQIIDEPEKPAFGRVNFPHAHVLNHIGAEERVAKARIHDQDSRLGRGEFLLIPHDTFVQPDIDQLYSFVTALPRTSSYVLVRASFRYEVRPSKMQLGVLRISRKVGMLQYSLDHVREPHTIERSFKIGGDREFSDSDLLNDDPV